MWLSHLPDTLHFCFMSLAISSFKLSISSISNDTQLYNSENLSEKTLAMLSSVSALSILFGLLLHLSRFTTCFCLQTRRCH